MATPRAHDAAEPLGLVVVGSGPAGVRAAQAYRDAGGAGPVVVVSADETAPYQRPPLSKDMLAGESPAEPTPIDDDDPELSSIDVRLRTRALALRPDEHVLETDAGPLPYAACVLAPGSEPKPFPDLADGADVLLLRTFTDGVRLRERAESADSAVVVGAGFIGCEAAASLAARGISVTLIAPSRPQESRLGREVSDWLTSHLHGLGVDVRVGEVTRIEAPTNPGAAARVILADGPDTPGGPTLEPDLVLTALGVRPATGWLPAGDLVEGRIPTDDHLRTPWPDVWAAGDAALAHNAAAARRVPVEHWGDAETMGRIAGANAAGGDEAWDAAPGFWSEIGPHTLKQSAWGDGHDAVHAERHGDGITVWYSRDDRVVGVVTNDDDPAYERGDDLVRRGAPLREIQPDTEIPNTKE
ncbi:NAD(P)/FAD-dependent oxidoreductase [Mariniluteicoccus flavus]